MFSFKDKAERLVYFRSFIAPKVAAEWRHFIEAYYASAGAQAPPVRVIGKPLRSYVHRAFWPRRRLAALLAHYRWMDANLTPRLIGKLCSGEALELAALRGKKGGVYRLSLGASITVATQREGEFALSLSRDDGIALARIAFGFDAVGAETALIIGGVQGPETGHKRAIIDSTRDLFGLRPKDAVLLATRAFARAFDPCAVHAVSDANHVLRRLQNVAKHASYDEYWRERGATPGGPYGFVFPPLAPLGDAVNPRDRAKAAIVDGVSSLLCENRIGASGRPSAPRALAASA